MSIVGHGGDPGPRGSGDGARGRGGAAYPTAAKWRAARTLREKPLTDPLVAKIQDTLSRLGFYRGPVDGAMNRKTEKAIRAYQRHAGLPVTGEATEKLLGSLETGDKVGALLQRLEETRRRTKDAARQALLGNPETRRLLQKDPDIAADPTRDPTPCYRDPTVSCLLGEASESAKAVFRNEMRDWVLGEILVVQARAGFTPDAMETARRIADPRLIMVALRDIAEARATAGRGSDALAAVEIIPDTVKQGEAIAAIAAIQARRNDPGGVSGPRRGHPGQGR